MPNNISKIKRVTCALPDTLNAIKRLASTVGSNQPVTDSWYHWFCSRGWKNIVI